MRLRLWFLAFDTLAWAARRIRVVAVQDALDRAQYYTLKRAGAAIDWEMRSR